MPPPDASARAKSCRGVEDHKIGHVVMCFNEQFGPGTPTPSPKSLIDPRGPAGRVSKQPSQHRPPAKEPSKGLLVNQKVFSLLIIQYYHGRIWIWGCPDHC